MPAAVHMPPLDGRLIQLWLYGRSHPDDNHYSHPIDIVVLVDLNLKKVGHQPAPPLVLTSPESEELTQGQQKSSQPIQ